VKASSGFGVLEFGLELGFSSSQQRVWQFGPKGLGNNQGKWKNRILKNGTRWWSWLWICQTRKKDRGEQEEAQQTSSHLQALVSLGC
jgi:hypothetical protein